MKAALVLFDWFPHGGLQRDCLRIGACLAAQGVKMDVLCMSWQGVDPPGMRKVVAELPATGKVARRQAFARFVADWQARERYDAVVGFNRLPGLDFYFAADTCFAWKAGRERNWFYRFSPRSRQYLAFERGVFGPASATRIFMLSPLQKAEYLACYPQAAGRITDVPPGIDASRKAGSDAAQVRREFRQEFAVAEEELLILQVGTGHPVKGVDRALAAVAALPIAVKTRARFFILGDDPHGRIPQQARALGIASAVTVMAGRNDLPRFYQGADLLLHPARKESAGMVILEAVIAGLPVLATATCGYAFHVEAAQAGKVLPEPFSQAALDAALAGMLETLAGGSNPWRENGIAYGRSEDLYAMPERVAAQVIAFMRERSDGR